MAGVAQDEEAAVAAAERDPSELKAFVADLFAIRRGRRQDEWREPPLESGAPSAGVIAANAGFVTAHIAGRASDLSGAAYAEGFTSERARQQAWLVDRLGF